MRHVYIDEYSDINSIIHRLDPRTKIISFIIFIIFIIFTRPMAFITFALYGILITILISLSKIPVKFILKRSLIIIPFVMMISIFIPFIKQGKAAGGHSLGTSKLVITYDGLMIFWNVLIKSYLSILCTILLTTSTRFSDLLRALERLKLPKLIMMILSFMYRYIFVVQDELMKMKQAKESRSVGGFRYPPSLKLRWAIHRSFNGGGWFHIKTLANMIGVLFIRTYERAESVYLAMCSRGFDGRTKTISNFQLTKTDLVFLFIMILSLFGTILLGR